LLRSQPRNDSPFPSKDPLHFVLSPILLLYWTWRLSQNQIHILLLALFLVLCSKDDLRFALTLRLVSSILRFDVVHQATNHDIKDLIEVDDNAWRILVFQVLVVLWGRVLRREGGGTGGGSGGGRRVDRGSETSRRRGDGDVFVLESDSVESVVPAEVGRVEEVAESRNGRQARGGKRRSGFKDRMGERWSGWRGREEGGCRM
jgi:hypothetical protein